MKQLVKYFHESLKHQVHRTLEGTTPGKKDFLKSFISIKTWVEAEQQPFIA